MVLSRILVINLAFIGDVLLSSPVIRALREAYPQAAVDMLTVPLSVPVAERNPYVRQVFAYDKRGKHRKLTELFALIRLLRQQHYDLAISLNFSLRSAFMAWASGASRRIGYDAQNGGWLLTDTLPADRSVAQHETLNHLAVLKPLGISPVNTSLALSVRPEDVAALRNKLALPEQQPIVLVCPIGSYRQKSLPTASYAALIRALAPYCRLFLIGAPKEAAGLAAINQAADGLATVVTYLTLGELAALIQAAAVLISVDTGPVHIAQALGTPVVALYGPTDPKIWGPRNVSDRVFYRGEACSPCWGRKECPDNICLTALDPAEITAAALRQVRRNEQAGGC